MKIRDVIDRFLGIGVSDIFVWIAFGILAVVALYALVIFLVYLGEVVPDAFVWSMRAFFGENFENKMLIVLVVVYASLLVFGVATALIMGTVD